MSTYKVLIVDDEPDICELVAMTLRRMEIDSRTAECVGEARERLTHEHFDVCLTDMRLPDGNGVELVRHIQELYPELPVAVITAYGSAETAVEALKAGAFDFVSKPVKLADLRNLVTAALKLRRSAYPQQERRTRNTLVGDSEVMQHIRGMIAKVARSQAPIYISGESGTGKELVARLIHERGPRADAPFIGVNCGAIPSELMESEFFGHKKGSFTGAVADKEGLFKAAHGGTLFLDEIAELPMHMQVKLLRAIQEKAVRRVGDEKETTVDVRILSATHKDLQVLVGSGKFRQDLFYRINVIELHVPSLRERREDIPVLTRHILTKLGEQMGLEPLSISERALEVLTRYAFPGNVRELENILERALTLCNGANITESELMLREEPAASEDDYDPAAESLDDYVSRVERGAIEKALAQTRGNKTAAAKMLGVTFRSLRYKLAKLGIQ